jgi:Transposase
MDANTANGNLADKQLRVIPFLLAAASIEEGCKQAGVGKATVYGWLKQDAFREELNRRRKEMVELAFQSFQANVSKATETLVKLLDSDKEPIRARAAEDIIEFTQKAIELEELGRRIAALEEKLDERRSKHGH